MKESHRMLPFREVAVLGAGVMGAQIAAHLANAGLRVHLLDIPPKEGPKNAIVAGAFKQLQKMKPNPFASKAAASRIQLGNFEEHFDRIRSAEWVIEVVIENLAIKQQLMERIEATVGPDTIVTTNTSGLPIHQILEGRSDGFKRRFMGTHFFNPPRYLQLLEIIPTPQTDPAALERIRWFGRVHLGKNIVIAKDTPNFIANRIGNYATLQAFRFFTDGDYTIEEIDTLTGPLIGHAKSATFRTADVVGLDTLKYVADNLYEAIPNDESRAAHQSPELLNQLVDRKLLGAKTRAGFYKKVGKDILSINPLTFEYEPAQALELGDLEAIKKIPDLRERIRALYADSGRAGAFTRESLLDLMGYCARRIPEIADSPADIDKAIRWGFAWEMGPFEMWDVLGIESVLSDMAEHNVAVPAWVEEMQKGGAGSFYRHGAEGLEVFVPGKGYVAEPRFADMLSVAGLKSIADKPLLERREAALHDMGEGVALYEFRSKSNTLGSDVVNGIIEAIDFVEQGDWAGLVIGNDGRNFSVGANLAEAGMLLKAGKLDEVKQLTQRFQEMILRIRYARKPVVTAVQGMALGGGCEICLASTRVVAAMETYMGLVELGVGLIPAGCGTTHLAARAAARAANSFESQIQPFLMQVFQTVATARTATSAYEIIELGLLDAEQLTVVMHAGRRLHVAREAVLRLANAGYMPPPYRSAIPVLGRQGRAAMESAAYQMRQAGFASEYDQYLAGRLAYILCGGDLTAPTEVDEDYLLRLERDVFFELLMQQKTQERVEHLLTTNKPLRN